MTLIFETVRKISPRYRAVKYTNDNGSEVAAWINSMSHYGAAAGPNYIIVSGLTHNDSEGWFDPDCYVLINEQTGELEILSENHYNERYQKDES